MRACFVDQLQESVS